jgi:predicted metal-dependent phosphoesterase TrpH
VSANRRGQKPAARRTGDSRRTSSGRRAPDSRTRSAHGTRSSAAASSSPPRGPRSRTSTNASRHSAPGRRTHDHRRRGFGRGEARPPAAATQAPPAGKSRVSSAPTVAPAKARPVPPRVDPPAIRMPPPAPPKPQIVAASSLEAYRELEQALHLVREVCEATETFEAFTQTLAAQNMPLERVRRLCDLTVGGDLHLHTTASDGKTPARKLPWMAKAMGLDVIAVTDHDSVSGCREAFREGMLIGVRVIPGVELSTDQSGLEILAYFPDAGRLFNFLDSRKAKMLNELLAARQATIHQKSLACLDHVNGWLRRQRVPASDLITLEEYDRWFGGVKPYFPGTLCVLGLKRLKDRDRARLKIHDPRTFNTKVVTPFLQAWDDRQPHRKGPGALAESFAALRSMLRAGVPVVTVLAHPKELVTKGKLSLGAVRKLVVTLAEEHGLDGIEVACSRDTADDVRYWKEIVAEYNATVSEARGSRRTLPLLATSHGSDFHVLAPGLATGEITLGFGILDERPQFRRGNLRPQMPISELFELLSRRARGRAGL